MWKKVFFSVQIVTTKIPMGCMSFFQPDRCQPRQRQQRRMGVPTPSFVNAGDGLFTHPIGEFVGGSRLGQFASQGVLGQFTWCTTLSRWTTVFSFG